MVRDADQVAGHLRTFAEAACKDQSPLYERLCLAMSHDELLLELTCLTPAGQPIPNLLFAAVQFLLLGGLEHPLADYYPSCTNSPRPADDAFPVFRQFCLEHQSQLRELILARRVQTNEVRRCAYLFPAFASVQQTAPERPLSLIEVGASGGLLLNWDQYKYCYGDECWYGVADASVEVVSEWRGDGRPTLQDQPAGVHERVGIDIHPVDVTDQTEARWLRSLIWPDQPHRQQLIEAAIKQFRRTPVRLLKGDAFDLLEQVVKAAAPDTTLCVFHCHTLNQLSEQRRDDFRDLLGSLSESRPLTQLSAEWLTSARTLLHAIQWTDGEPTEKLLARIDHHGRWVEWLA